MQQRTAVKTAKCCQQNLSTQQVFARIQTEKEGFPTWNMHKNTYLEAQYRRLFLRFFWKLLVKVMPITAMILGTKKLVYFEI